MSLHLLFAELALSIAHPSLQSSYMEEDNCKWHQKQPLKPLYSSGGGKKKITN